MNVFIGGSIGIKQLDCAVMSELQRFIGNNAEILVGDACGADRLVQAYFAAKGYKSVQVYASGGKVRNNLGGWKVNNIDVPSEICGKAYYMQKDIAMTADCDCGFMIWNGKSKATLANIRRLSAMGKVAHVYLTYKGQMQVISGNKDYIKLLGAKGIAKLLTRDTPIEEIVSYCNDEQDFERIVAEFIKLGDEHKS